MSQAEVLASHWVLLFFLGLLNKYMLVWSVDYASVGRSSTRSDYLHRTWSEWSEWSACSRTCGGGAKMRTRVCKISTMHGVVPHLNSCIGETVEYELCSVHNCSPYDKEFLEYQCSLRDGQIVRGKRVEEWIPYRYGKNPCELQCWSKDRSIVYSFGKAIDGTKCATSDPKQPALCINGRCTPVDCAGQIGSDNKLDRCGICRGNNLTCIYYKDIFWGRPRVRTSFDESKDHHYDYEKITTIPAGVTEVLIKESSETNFLALMDHKGNFLVNGNWRIQSPAQVVIHGSEFMYNRTWDGRELVSAQGPTRYDVHVYVLGSGDIPTVNFEYWISTTNPLKPSQPFPVLNQIKRSETKDDNNDDDSKYLQPENNHIHDARPTKKQHIPVTQFQGYKSYYHRNEILRSVPSWSIKRHRTHKNNLNRYLHAQNDISSSTVKNSAELNTAATPHTKQANADKSRTGVRHDQLEKHQNVLGNGKMHSYQTKPKISPSDTRRDVTFSKIDHIYLNTTIKPLYTYNVYDLKQRQSVNVSSRVHRRRFQSYGRTAGEQERTTTAINLLRNNRYHRQDSVVTLEPGLLYREPESNAKHKNGRRRQKLLKNDKQSADEKKKRSKKKRKSDNDICQPCAKSTHQKKKFCTSEFVLRAVVLTIEKQGDSFRYELQISQSYKNRVPISPREYIWTRDLCRCPKLRTGKEYVIMGYSGASGNRRESRLLIDRNSFVKKYSSKRARTIQKLVRDQDRICRQFQ